MSIYRGAGGAGDAVNDASSEAVLVQQLANEAQADADAASASATAAAGSASAASTSASNASTSASNAATSATNASNSASSASTSATNAANSATAAQTAETAAELAETNAETAQAAAASSASAASSSASAASTSATNASNSASAASTSATNASNSASAASTSASNASTSATAAAGSASSASTSASNASTSATNAASSATSASTSATTATTQAGIATTKAGEAATSATNASNSASAASTSATNASNSATAAAGSATTASSAADAALAALDNFDDRYLGQKSTAPTLDNDGNALLAGALYFNTVSNSMKVYTGTVWVDAYADGNTFLAKASNLSDLANAATARTNLGVAIGTNVQAWDADLDTWATKTAPSGTVVGTSDTQTLTNKTIALGSNTVSGTLAQFNTAVTDADLVSLAGTETLTNKTLTSPTLTTPALGTPASGVVTNLTGTASININGTVGATTPAAGTFTSLSDSGNLTFTGTGNRITGDFSNGTESNRVLVQTSTTDGATNFGLIPNGTGAGAIYRAYNNSSATNSARAVFGFVGGTSELGIRSEITGTGTYLPMVFYTGGSERLRIDTSGNVGIGTSSPSYKLDVVGNANSPITSASQNSNSGVSATARFLAISDGGNAQIAACSTGYTDVTGAADSMMLNASSMSNGIVFATDGVIRMKLDSSGNVGIGSSSPTTKLQVTGTIHATGAGSFPSTGVGIEIVPSVTTGTNYIQAYNRTGSTWENLEIGSGRTVFSTGGTERMRIDSSGNVGIGTSSPNANLQLGAGGAVLRIGITASNQYGDLYRDGATGNIILNAAQASFGNLVFQTTSTERMRIDTSGNVGIGTSSPQRRLHSYDGVSDNCILAQSGAGNAYIGFADNGTTSQTGLSVRLGSAGNAMVFQTGGTTERMRIDSSGNLLVNTTTVRNSGRMTLDYAGNSANGITINDTTSTNGSAFLSFFTGGTSRGSVSNNNNTGVLYNVTSDYRLKTVVAPISDAGQRIDALEPIEYDWNTGGRTRGFLAHQFAEVYPNSVSGAKDAVDKEGKPIYQAMQSSSTEVMADLIAEIQSLRKRVAQLESK